MSRGGALANVSKHYYVEELTLTYTYFLQETMVDVEYSSFLMFWKFQYSLFLKSFLILMPRMML